MSKPAFVPTQKQREQVEALAGLLVEQTTIAKFLEIDPKTLRKYFRAELDNGPELTGLRLKAILYASARNGSIRATTYLCDKLRLFPEAENGGAQAPAQVIVRVHGGLAGVEEHINAPPR